MQEQPKYSILDHRVAGWYLPWMMKGLRPTSSPLESKIRLMKRLGFDGVGTSWWDLVSYYQERGDLEQIRDLCSELAMPLTAYGFVAEGWAFGSGLAQRNAMLLAQSSLDLAHAAGCAAPYLLGPFDSGPLRDAAKAFRELAQYASALGMELALEFAGVAAQIRDIDSALEVVDAAGEPSAGIALDSYHFFAGGGDFAGLERMPPARLQVVHLADAPADLSDPSLELDREMPGEGQLPLQKFVQAVDRRGFRGYWHVESIQGRDYAADLETVAAHGLTCMRSVVESALGTRTAAHS